MALDFQKDDFDVKPFRKRLLFLYGLVIFFFSLLVCRFAWLQIINQTSYVAKAERNRTVTVTLQGTRGLIYDRNNEILAQNKKVYSIEITPDKVKNMSDTIAELGKILQITPADIRRFNRLREDLQRYDSIPLRQGLTEQEVAIFLGQAWRFPGVEINQRQYRFYLQGATGSHFLGYIGSLSQSDQRRLKLEGTLDNYDGERNIGKVGLERSYETALHGTPGHETLEITAGGHAVRSLGLTPPAPGKDLHLSIDMNLQRVIEDKFGKEKGALIAIEPKTGEILAFVSMPTYDPNLFPGGIDPVSWNELNTSEDKPLFNRAMRGTYPIGSTYKPFMALAGLSTGTVSADYVLNDTGVFMLGNHKFRDASGVPKGLLNMRRSIAMSSDVYYYWLATKMGVDKIHDFMKPWGFGQKTGIDLIGEQAGILPSRQWKEERFKRPWVLGDTPSIGIGQGYNSFTLLQLAHAVATLANRGIVMTPHLVKGMTDPWTRSVTLVDKDPTATIPLKPSHLDTVIDGMVDVTKIGTGRSVFAKFPFEVAGKTGTAQVVSVAQDENFKTKVLRKKQQDHALFIAFAPAHNPKIALAVLVENGGFGAQAAAPIAKAALQYWLTGENSLGLPPPAHVKNQVIITTPTPPRRKAP